MSLCIPELLVVSVNRKLTNQTSTLTFTNRTLWNIWTEELNRVGNLSQTLYCNQRHASSLFVFATGHRRYWTMTDYNPTLHFKGSLNVFLHFSVGLRSLMVNSHLNTHATESAYTNGITFSFFNRNIAYAYIFFEHNRFVAFVYSIHPFLI